MNVGKSKVIRCWRHVNVSRMHVRLNGKPIMEVDCFKFLWSQVAGDGGCEKINVVHRMNEYKDWGTLKRKERIEDKCDEVSI